MLLLILFTAIARLLLDYVHSRRASKEIIFTYPAFFLAYTWRLVSKYSWLSIPLRYLDYCPASHFHSGVLLRFHLALSLGMR